MINESLKQYIEKEIIPRYDSFDKGHQRDHVMYVIDQAVYLGSFYETKPDILYTAAAYHDTGLCVDRASHHLESGKIIRADKKLEQWFTADEIELIACAAEDHRASSKDEPRSIYGKIIAEADRQIIPETVIRRTIQFGLFHYPDLDKEGNWNRTVEHLLEKYYYGGYLKLWIPESPNTERLESLRKTIADREQLRATFERLYSEITKDTL